jgi:hypothetical protein
METMSILMKDAPRQIEQWCHDSQTNILRHMDYLARSLMENDARLRTAYENAAAAALTLSKAQLVEAMRLLRAFEDEGGVAPIWISSLLRERHH